MHDDRHKKNVRFVIYLLFGYAIPKLIDRGITNSFP
jgi:hypothetical protein